MKGIDKGIYCLLAFVVLCSCKNVEADSNTEDLLRDQYFNLEKIGWKSRQYVQKSDDISFTATEVPIQYYLLKNKGTVDLVEVDSLYNTNKTERVIEFSFQQDDEKDLLKEEFTGMPYDDSVKYMSFGLEKDFYVVTSKNDTIQCAGVTFERNFKIAPYNKVLLFFSGIDPNERIQLVYTDYLFRKGTLKFKFKDTYTEIAL